MQPILENHDRAQFEVHGYFSGVRHDSVTERIASLVAEIAARREPLDAADLGYRLDDGRFDARGERGLREAAALAAPAHQHVGDVVLDPGELREAAVHGEARVDLGVEQLLDALLDGALEIRHADVAEPVRGTGLALRAFVEHAAELPAVMLALDARITVCRSSDSRTIPAAEFFTGLFSTALEEGEFVQPGRVVAVLVDLDRVELRVFLPQRELVRRRGGIRPDASVHLGCPRAGRLDQELLLAVLLNRGDQVLDGQNVPAVETTLLIRLRLPDPGARHVLPLRAAAARRRSQHGAGPLHRPAGGGQRTVCQRRGGVRTSRR